MTTGIDVRKIVLDVIERNDEARTAYLTDPAMHHGVEVTIGVLGRVAEVLVTSGIHGAESLIKEIAVACSRSGGPEREQIIAAANSNLFGGPLPH